MMSFYQRWIFFFLRLRGPGWCWNVTVWHRTSMEPISDAVRGWHSSLVWYWGYRKLNEGDEDESLCVALWHNMGHCGMIVCHCVCRTCCVNVTVVMSLCATLRWWVGHRVGHCMGMRGTKGALWVVGIHAILLGSSQPQMLTIRGRTDIVGWTRQTTNGERNYDWAQLWAGVRHPTFSVYPGKLARSRVGMLQWDTDQETGLIHVIQSYLDSDFSMWFYLLRFSFLRFQMGLLGRIMGFCLWWMQSLVFGKGSVVSQAAAPSSPGTLGWRVDLSSSRGSTKRACCMEMPSSHTLSPPLLPCPLSLLFLTQCCQWHSLLQTPSSGLLQSSPAVFLQSQLLWPHSISPMQFAQEKAL
jgi:hypothetical protein